MWFSWRHSRHILPRFLAKRSKRLCPLFGNRNESGMEQAVLLSKRGGAGTSTHDRSPPSGMGKWKIRKHDLTNSYARQYRMVTVSAIG
jgi:hypothetical protein